MDPPKCLLPRALEHGSLGQYQTALWITVQHYHAAIYSQCGRYGRCGRSSALRKPILRIHHAEAVLDKGVL